MKKVLLIIVLSFITTLNYAQGDSSKLSSNAIIQCSCGKLFSRNKFTVSGKQVTRNEINSMLMNSPASASEFKEFKKDRNRTYYFGIPAFSFLVGSIIAGGQSNTLKNTPSKVLAGIGFGLAIPEFIFGIKRDKHHRRSFMLYNQQFH